MIARRNNVRDHQTLKRARRLSYNNNDNYEAKKQRANASGEKRQMENLSNNNDNNPGPETSRKRRQPSLFSDAYVAKEMDVPAVVATRSYRAWLKLEDGEEFVYNQKYVKGKDGHDWLLRKNIWRRMRYRRENKKMVEEMRQILPSSSAVSPTGATANKHSVREVHDSFMVAKEIAMIPS